ncbi:hypothetical protein ACRYCC_39375 [Actinomadura scrupuli]|uniref:hypothetical protein n=1 Tax=Actinomadura scrupuli TaxID=559629 RepID=UPI003D96AD67
MNGHDPVDAVTAQGALDHAARLRATVDHRSRWLVRYQTVFGAAAFLMVLTLGMLDGPAGVIAGTAVWVAVIVALSVYAIRQPVAHRGTAVAHGAMLTTWGLLYATVLAVGTALFPGEPGWWLPGAVAVSLPGFVSAYLTSRRLARPERPR